VLRWHRPFDTQGETLRPQDKQDCLCYLLGMALFGGGDDVGHYEDVVFVAEIAGGGSEDCFGADVEFAVAGEGHADVVFAEEFGDFDGWGERVGGHRGTRLRG